MLTLEQRRLALFDAAREALESLVFSEVELDRGTGTLDSGEASAAIALGEYGELCLQIRTETLLDIASVIYTLDPKEVTESVQQDTLMEILNIVAGRFCLKMLGEGAEFQLGLPHSFPNFPSVTLENEASCRLSLDGLEALQFRHRLQASAT